MKRYKYAMSAVTGNLPASARLETPVLPALENGDRLTRAEFERRYHAMPGLKKAELIEGVVYVPSPVRFRRHSQPHVRLATWLGVYESQTVGVALADNATVRLDLDNEPQPDLVLFKVGASDAQAAISEDDYIEGAPELVVEIASSSASYDLNQKKGAFRRNGIREYLAWVVLEERLVWWRLDGGEYVETSPDDRGILKSVVFPGLWLDVPALLRGEMKAVLETLDKGVASR